MLMDTKADTCESETFLVLQPCESLNCCNCSSVTRKQIQGTPFGTRSVYGHWIITVPLRTCSRGFHIKTLDGSLDACLKPGDSLSVGAAEREHARLCYHPSLSFFVFSPPPYTIPWEPLGGSVLPMS